MLLFERQCFAVIGTSCDVSQFVVHECPPAAIADFVREGFRILRPGGVLMISDNDPRRACGMTSVRLPDKQHLAVTHQRK